MVNATNNYCIFAFIRIVLSVKYFYLTPTELCDIIRLAEVLRMPKDLKYSILLDHYGNMLTEKQRDVLGLYYNEDLSLSEIAEIVGTSRQGVMDNIKRSEAQLLSFEKKLSLVKHYQNVDKAVVLLNEILELGVSGQLSEKLSEVISLLNGEGV